MVHGRANYAFRNKGLTLLCQCLFFVARLPDLNNFKKEKEAVVWPDSFRQLSLNSADSIILCPRQAVHHGKRSVWRRQEATVLHHGRQEAENQTWTRNTLSDVLPEARTTS